MWRSFLDTRYPSHVPWILVECSCPFQGHSFIHSIAHVSKDPFLSFLRMPQASYLDWATFLLCQLLQCYCSSDYLSDQSQNLYTSVDAASTPSVDVDSTPWTQIPNLGGRRFHTSMAAEAKPWWMPIPHLNGRRCQTLVDADSTPKWPQMPNLSGRRFHSTVPLHTPTSPPKTGRSVGGPTDYTGWPAMGSIT